MDRRSYLGLLGGSLAVPLAGCSDEPNPQPTPESTPMESTPTRTPEPTTNSTSEIPEHARRYLLRAEDLDDEWSLVSTNIDDNWYTHEFERTNDDGLLNVLFSDVWIYDDVEGAREDYETREADYENNYQTTSLDIGEEGLAWADQIAVGTFYEESALGQIEYQLYQDDGRLGDAAVESAVSYSSKMYERW